MFEALLIRLLEDSGSKARAHSHSGIHDGSGDLICFHLLPPLCVPLKSSVVPILEARINIGRAELLTASEDRYNSARTDKSMRFLPVVETHHSDDGPGKCRRIGHPVGAFGDCL